MPRDILGEVSGEKVVLTCGKHGYVASKKRGNGVVVIPPNTRGCKECWMVYYVTDLAMTPPGKRQERVDELEEVIHRAIEYEQKGKFGDDFELYEPTDPRFSVQYAKDAADDETGKDRVIIPGEENL